MLRRRENLLTATAQTTTITSDVKTCGFRVPKRLLARIASTNVTPGTLDVVVQHSPHPTATTGWKTLIAFAQQTTGTGDAGIEDVHLNLVSTHIWPHFRAVATIAGGGSYTFSVDLWFD